MSNSAKLDINDRATWLRGELARCSVPPPAAAHAWRLILLGAPGVGKGTQAELLSERLGVCHLSTGDVFRAAKSTGAAQVSPALCEALTQMRRGELVQDQTVLAMVSERMRCLRCQGGFILDGFPRTEPQAQALEELLTKEGIELSAVLNYELPMDEIVSRLSGRRTCSRCKAVFHVETRPSRSAGTCDHCGGELIVREDDRPEAIRVRMEAYEHSTKPLIQYYRKRRVLISVKAAGDPEQIYGRTLTALAGSVA